MDTVIIPFFTVVAYVMATFCMVLVIVSPILLCCWFAKREEEDEEKAYRARLHISNQGYGGWLS